MRMRSIIALVIAVPVAITAVYFKTNEIEKISERSEAWNDGFEVVVVSSDGNIQPMHLKEAINISRVGGSLFLDKGNEEVIIKSIIEDRKRLHNFSESNTYPIVNISIEPKIGEKQNITYSVHYSNRSFSYSTLQEKMK